MLAFATPETGAGSWSDASDGAAAVHVARFKAGDARAFEALYLLYFQSVFAYLRIVLQDSDDAEDATQQVFTRALEALPRFEPRAPFRAWLFTIARNQGLSTRRERGRVELNEPLALERRRPLEPAGEHSLGLSVHDHALLSAMRVLPPVQRQVLILRFVFDFASDEIGTIVDRSPDAVRQLQSRGLKALRSRLEPLRAAAQRPRQAAA
jgi:RNA polymerase sigma-70 factor (ECF subfamily)